MLTYRMVNLRNLIIALSVGSVVVTATVLLTLVYQFQSNDFGKNIQDNNATYAQKLADSIDHYFDQANTALAWSARAYRQTGNRAQLIAEANRLNAQIPFFNAVAVVDKNNVVDAIFPLNPAITGKALTSTGSLLATQTRQPMISRPYMSSTGNYMVLISQPLFTREGDADGFLGGVTYLQKKSELNALIQSYHYSRDTHISIMTWQGEKVYDSELSRVGQPIDASPDLLENLQRSQAGERAGKLSGKRSFVGYATVQSTGWKVLIYTHEETVASMMISSISLSAGVILPILLLISVTAAFLSSKISTPLTRLAWVTENSGPDVLIKNILGINVWYYEAKILRKSVYKSLKAMQSKVSRLNNDAITDQLTALYNRRGLIEKMKTLSTVDNVILMIDIDHFKMINDKYGHDTGDRTLAVLAKRLLSLCRNSDIVSRFGGEEFVVVLTGSPPEIGARIAERIRKGIAEHHEEGIPPFTASVGVFSMSSKESNADNAIKLADIALYAAKDAGRNCVVINEDGTLRRYPQGGIVRQSSTVRPYK